VFLAGHSVTMVTYLITNMIGEFFDSLIVASSDKEWLKRSLLYQRCEI